MEKDLFIEQTMESLATLIVNIEDREDRADFNAVVQLIEEVRDELTELVES